MSSQDEPIIRGGQFPDRISGVQMPIEPDDEDNEDD